MPPRRGGRGRGKMRARPPQVIRNSMAELGMGSITTFELLAKAAAAQNADAARAFFPVLDPERKAEPMRLSESEEKVMQLSRDLKMSINNSPCAVERQRPKGVSGLETDLSTIKNYFCVPSANGENSKESESLWDLDKCWVIPEIIPSELVPSHVRRNGSERKRRRIAEDDEGIGINQINRGEALLDADDEANDTRAEGQSVAQREDDDDAEGQAGEPEGQEEDDDLELDADYQTGVRFDDDDGYDDPDSGAEEATF